MLLSSESLSRPRALKLGEAGLLESFFSPPSLPGDLLQAVSRPGGLVASRSPVDLRVEDTPDLLLWAPFWLSTLWTFTGLDSPGRQALVAANRAGGPLLGFAVDRTLRSGSRLPDSWFSGPRIPEPPGGFGRHANPRAGHCSLSSLLPPLVFRV